MREIHGFCLLLAFTLLGALVQVAGAAEDVRGDDGQEYRLHEDGRWSVLVRDRFATASDGRRIRLRPDGTWQAVVEDVADVIIPADNASAAVASTPHDGVAILLTAVELWTVKTKTLKSVRTDTQMRFTLALSNDGDEPLEVASLAPEQLEVRDSRGRTYTVLSIQAAQSGIAPGDTGAEVGEVFRHRGGGMRALDLLENVALGADELNLPAGLPVRNIQLGSHRPGRFLRCGVLIHRQQNGSVFVLEVFKHDPAG